MTTTANFRAELGERYAHARAVTENMPEIIPGAGDEVYVSVSIRPSAGGQMPFNAQTGRILYDVVVSGVKIHWPRTSILHTRLSGRDDLLNVTIHADTLVLAQPIKLPGANVTIQARVLQFENEEAVIDTTPISHRQTAGRSSDALPAADGQDGTKGGDIFLRVGELWLGDQRIDADTKIANPRLIATGGNGQNGEPPRYEGEKPLSLVPVTAKQMHEVIRGFGLISEPDDYSFPDLSKFDAGQVVHVNFMTVNVNLLAPGNVTCTWIPGGTTTSHMITSSRVIEDLWQETPKGRQRPGNGRPALHGGRPGDGGRGGDIEVINAALARASGGNGGRTEGLAGDPAGTPKPAYHARILATRNFMYQQTMPPRADFVEVSGSPGQSLDPVVGEGGLAGAVRTPSRDWLTAALLAPLIRYAGDLFANGFRERARVALEPYRFLLTANGEFAGAATVQLIELSRRIDSNLDDFGQRPGWVPRLNASTTFAILTSQLKANLELMSLSGASLRDWDALVDRHEVLTLTLDSLEAEQERLWRELDDGYQGLQDAQRQLDAINADVESVDREMAAFRNGIAAMAAVDEVRGKILQGAAAVVGGLLQLCPVGQPYVGAASAVFKAVEGFAAGDGARTLGDGLRDEVQTFLTDQQDMFKSSGNSELRQKMNAARKQASQYGKRIEAIAREAEGRDRDAVLRRSWAAREAAKVALEQYDLLNGDGDSKSRADYARTLAQETAAWRKHRTEQESAEYQRRLKDAQTTLERAKEDREERDRETVEALRRVKLAAAGVGDLIRGIGLMTSSMRPDDPAILAKVDDVIAQLPPVSDLGLQYRGIVDKASALSLRRGQAASMVLLQGQRIAAALAGIATNTENATSLTDMRRDVADATLGAELRGTFEAIQSRSRRRIESQMNAFVRAYQYEHLTDVPSQFKGLALVLPRLSAYRLRRVKAGAAPTAGDPILDTDSAHAAVAIKDAYLSLLDQLLRQRALQAANTAYSAAYALTRDELLELATAGRLRLNLVAAELVSLDDVKHRIRLVEVLDMAMAMAPEHSSDQVRFSVTHAPTSLVRGASGDYYAFQQAADEAPISWAWRYQVPPPGTTMPAWQSETKLDDDGVMQEVLRTVLPNATLRLREYSPSSFSDMLLALEVGGVRRQVSSVVRSIDRLTLRFTFEHEPQAPQLRKAAVASAKGVRVLPQ